MWKTFLGPSRLRKKFVRTFLLTGLIPLVLMGTVSIYLVNLTHRIDVENLEINLSRQVAVEVKKIVDEAQAILELAVTFEEFAPVAFIQQDFLLESILKDNDSLVGVSFVCLTPRQCVLGKETKRWLRSEVGLVSNSDLRSLSEDPAFLAAKEGKNYIGAVQFRSDGVAINLAAPVFNKKGEIIAVLSGDMNLRALQIIVENTRLGETGYVYIVDGTNKIIAYPDQKFIGQNVGALPAVKNIISMNVDEASRKAVYSNLNGELVLGSGTIIEDLGWGVIAEWPRAETQEIIRTILWQIGGFSLLTILIIALIASWVALRLIQPIAELREGTSIIGSGNFNYRVHIKTGDELEDLGANLNKMAENLKGLEEVHELRLRTELLAESLKKEQELSKLKDQFITTVSHQFNTPLSVINWAVEALKSPDIKPGEIQESAKIISKSQRDIVAIVSDLITLSEVGFRYQKDKAKKTDVAVLIQNVSDSFGAVAKLKRVLLEFKTTTANTFAEINDFTIKKVFENLIDNAISYSNEGDKIEMELQGDNRKLIFKITDQGIGIPKTDQSLIFQQFFRAKNAVAKKNVGTGLGLFIVKSIVEGHGGKITFESEESKGTTFTVIIPR